MNVRAMLLFVVLSAFFFAAGAMTLSEGTLQQAVKTYLQDLQATLDPDVVNLSF